MTGSPITIATPHFGRAAVAKLFDLYLADREISAGTYTEVDALHHVLRSLPIYSQQLAEQLLCDAETIGHWATLKIGDSVGSEAKAAALTSEVITDIKRLKLSLSALNAVPLARRKLSEEYTWRSLADENEMDETAAIEGEADAAIAESRQVQQEVEPTVQLADKTSVANPQPLNDGALPNHAAGMDFFLQGNDAVVVFKHSGIWEELARLESSLVNLQTSAAEIANKESSARAASKRSTASLRGAPKDDWSKFAVCLLACCWKDRLNNSAIGSGRMRAKSFPYASAFRSFVPAALAKVHFPNVRKSGFTRQVTEVLQDKIAVPPHLLAN